MFLHGNLDHVISHNMSCLGLLDCPPWRLSYARVRSGLPDSRTGLAREDRSRSGRPGLTSRPSSSRKLRTAKVNCQSAGSRAHSWLTLASLASQLLSVLLAFFIRDALWTAGASEVALVPLGACIWVDGCVDVGLPKSSYFRSSQVLLVNSRTKAALDGWRGGKKKGGACTCTVTWPLH
jgi:hypothetical protein